MCLILFAYHAHPEYPLVLLANRDEFYQRRTQQAHWWTETPDLLAGKDLKAGGTWMGITRTGHLAAVTNVRAPHNKVDAPKSRGLLVRQYLETRPSVTDFGVQLQETANHYLGFNLLFGPLKNLTYFSNRGQRQKIAPGIYGLSNAQLDTAWPKVVIGKRLLQQQLTASRLNSEALLPILSPTDIISDDQLPSTGVGIEWERTLSAICINGETYGTRSSTVLLINNAGQVAYHEKQRHPEAEEEVKIEFNLP